MQSLTAREAVALEVARAFMATATQHEFVGIYVHLTPGGSVHNPEQGFMTRFRFPEGDVVDVYVKVKSGKGQPTPISLKAKHNRKTLVEINDLEKSLSQIKYRELLGEELLQIFSEFC